MKYRNRVLLYITISNADNQTLSATEYRPVDLCNHLAHYLLAHVCLHLHGSYELSWLDEVADVDARVVTDSAPDSARSIEEERLQQQYQRRPLVVGNRSTTTLIQRLLLHHSQSVHITVLHVKSTTTSFIVHCESKSLNPSDFHFSCKKPWELCRSAFRRR